MIRLRHPDRHPTPRIHFASHRMVVHCKFAPYSILIDCTTKWGNPFLVGPDGVRMVVVHLYAAYMAGQPGLVRDARAELRGRVLGCHCAPLPCHGHVLYRIASGASVAQALAAAQRQWRREGRCVPDIVDLESL